VTGKSRPAQVISARRPRHLLTGSAVALGAAALVLGIGLVVAAQYLLLWVAVAAALALVFLYGTVSTAMAGTRFDAAGVRTRGMWGGADQYPWDQIANVAVQRLVIPSRGHPSVWYVVALVTTAGDHVRLSAPMSRSASDPEFASQFRQIRDAWQRATGSRGTPEATESALLSAVIWLALAAGAQLIALVMICATVPYFAPAWAAHEGGGTPGVFTAGVRNCPQRACSWFGTFTAVDDRARDATLEPGGPAIRAAGYSVTAVSTGRKRVVYPAGGGTAWELPTAGIATAAGVVLALLAAELLVPVWRKRARHRRAALAVAHLASPQ